MTLTLATGYSPSYLTKEVATGRENYYTGAVTAGEPPGRWYGRGAEVLRLSGLVDEQDMTALYERFIDPRDPAFNNPEQWDQASTLGHTGRAYKDEAQLYAEALNAEPDADGERRAELRLEAGKRARKNVAFIDATFSVQKSITVLHTAFEAQAVTAHTNALAAEQAAADAREAGDEIAAARWERRAAEAQTVAESWDAHRTAVEDAVWAGNNAALDYLADHAGYSRIGHHGGSAGRFIDAHDFVVASFFQHDSRNHDPQLHIHNAILNRVQGADGVWRTLDSRALHKFRGAAAAVAERTTEQHLAGSLGVRFAARPDGKAREVVGIAAPVMDLFSSRRRAITAKTATLVEAFETKFGREPNALELDRLQRQATLATRAAKSHEGETVEQRLERWDTQLRTEVAGGLAEVATTVLAGRVDVDTAAVESWSPTAVIETALADVQATKAAWTAPDLTRAISDALPDQLGQLDGAQTARLLDTLTTQALTDAVALDADRPGHDQLPDALRLADGRSAYDAPGGRLYATAEHVHSERTLVRATARGGAPALDPTTVDAFVESLAAHGVRLGDDQAAAVRGVLTSGGAVESLVGPAGTGKSFVVGALAKVWTDPALWDGQQRRVVGLAASQIAANVLTGEGLDALNITRWLAAQDRITAGRPAGDDTKWALNAGDLVVVDESSMADTSALVAIYRHALRAGAKLLLTGDHRQLAAVGAGGAMEIMADAGPSYELTDARRFTEQWERAASLRLRAGDQTVLGDYHKHGRLLDCGTVAEAEQSAARAWLADTLDGKRSLLIVDKNEQAAALSAQLRGELVRLGHVTEHGVRLGMQGTYAGVGDLIQARHNAWHLASYDGNTYPPINRELYRVLDTHPDGSITAAVITGHGPDGEIRGGSIHLPASYVAEHVSLGYAVTVHAAEGLTRDTAHPVITPQTNVPAAYVGLTRGRERNTAHVATTTGPADQASGTVGDQIHRSPAAVLAAAFDNSTPERSALAVATESLDDVTNVRTPAELLADAIDLATAGRTAGWLDQMTANGTLTPAQRTRIAAEDGAATLNRVLRRAELAGHDPQKVLTDAIVEQPLTDARQLTNVIHYRITSTTTLHPTGDTFTSRVPAVDDPQWQIYLNTLAETADQRRGELGNTVAAEAPQWAVEALGSVPEDPKARNAWIDAAGVVAVHREMSGHTDPAVAIGPAPRTGQTEQYASWRAAWRALGRPEADRAEAEMSVGQLRIRARAYEREQAWAPTYVGEELAGTHQTAAQHRQTAVMRRAEARNTLDPTEHQRLIDQADQADALAEALDHRADQLAAADAARSTWLSHTAETRAVADRATAELSAREAAGRLVAEPVVTAEEWLTAHTEHTRDEDQHRAITTEADLADHTRVSEPMSQAIGDGTPTVETGRADIREITASEPKAVERDTVHVPTATETAATIDRAQRALTEIREREAAERDHAAAESRERETRWHTDDLRAEQTATRDSTALER